MSNVRKSASASSGTKKQKAQKQNTADKTQENSRVNWHEAAACALQIELSEYSDLLEYQTEYILGSNSYRIDLLVIKKLTEQVIPKNIALIFKTFNLFEIKGIGSTLSIDAYYKTIGYAGLLIAQRGSKNQYSRRDISLTFLSCHYPRKLMKHLHSLQKEMKITVEKSSSGVYHINKETFHTQIIVTRELPPEDNLYLRCLTNKLQDVGLINRLADDYKLHQEQDIYIKYMNQITTANISKEGDSPMVCEGILKLCGTSSKEIIERTKKEQADYYLPKLNELSAKNEQQALSIKQLTSSNEQLTSSNEQLTSSNEQLTSSNEQQASFIEQLTSQIDRLESLIKQHNISFE